jgi:hypothetical protein
VEARRHYCRLRRRAAIGQLIMAAENFTMWSEYASGGLLSGSFRHSYPHWGKRFPRLTAVIDSSWFAKTLDVLSFSSAAATLTMVKTPRIAFVTAATNAVTYSLTRIRNGYGRDGSDEMQELLGWYDLLSRAEKSQQDRYDVFLQGVNLQMAISYCASGLVKATSEQWRRGTAFEDVMRTSMYGDPLISRILEAVPGSSTLICWQTLLWESLYPLSYLLPYKAFLAVIASTEVFHGAIGQFMGLPRFFWAFGASHEAAIYAKKKMLKGGSA